ncbi:MAG: SHOCT domain-containing protein [Tissierellales bacterium]|jgi:uncharacterized membrane protein|nr:SHOCT domain-containing protein [Tissierellales bacterium]
MFLIIIAVLILIYFVYKDDGENIFNKSNKALDRLNDRYIKGEITEEEYIKMKENLKK